MRNEPKKDNGFSLIEVMITLVLMSILMTGSTALFEVLYQSQKRVVENKLLASFYFAKSEAIRLKSTIGVCRSEDQSTCSSANGNWRVGWLIYVNENNNNRRESTERILRAYGPLSSKISLVWNDGRSWNFNNLGKPVFASNRRTMKVCHDSSAGDGFRVYVYKAGFFIRDRFSC